MRKDIYEHVKRERQLRKLNDARQKLIGEKVQEVEESTRLGHRRCSQVQKEENMNERPENIKQRLAALEMKQT